MTTNNITVLELYEAVWEYPLKVLADRWGVHPHVLGKLLDVKGIPRPSGGYWTKKSMGKPVDIEPLPENLPGQRIVDLTDLKAAKKEKSKPQKQRLPEPDKSIGRYPLLKRLKSSFKKSSYSHDYLLTQQYDDLNIIRVEVSEEAKYRAINIMHTILGEFERQNWPVRVVKHDYQRRATNIVTVDGEEIGFRLRERLKQQKRPLTDEDKEELKRWGRIWHEKINVPTGILTPTIEGPCPKGNSGVFEDKTTFSLEDQLGTFISTLVLTAENSNALHAEREKEQLLREEQSRLHRKYDRIVNEQVNNIEHFLDQFSSWQKSKEIRTFISAMTEHFADGEVPSQTVGTWLTWANGIADAIDPTHCNKLGSFLSPEHPLFEQIKSEALNKVITKGNQTTRSPDVTVLRELLGNVNTPK